MKMRFVFKEHNKTCFSDWIDCSRCSIKNIEAIANGLKVAYGSYNVEYQNI